MENIRNISQSELRSALDGLTAHLTGLTIAVNNLKAVLTPDEETSRLGEFDPRDPANKMSNGKLTDRGIEVCYRLFDRGENRNKVAEQMVITFTAATHRYNAWLKLGGPERQKGTLD
jgi:hypothetical protein